MVGTLRAPWVGVPDSALGPLWQRNFATLLATADASEEWEMAIHHCIQDSARHTSLPGGEWTWLESWPQVLEDFCHRARELRELLRQGRILDFVRMWRESLGAWQVEAGMFLGAHRLANLDRLEQQVLDGFMTPDRSCLQVVADLRRSLEAGEEREENSPGDESMDAVRVMTIHKSKGLTFDHVYVVNTHGGRRSGAGSVVEWNSFEGRPAFQLNTWPNGEAYFAEEAAQKREIGESIRALYVAMTRPKKRLVLTGWFRSSDSFDPNAQGTFADLLAPRIARGELASATTVGRKRDKENVGWVVPSATQKTPALPSAGKSSFVSGSFPYTPWTSDEMQTARQDARRIMETPVFSTPSMLGKERTSVSAARETLAPTGLGLHAMVGTLVHRFFETLLDDDGNPDADWRAQLRDWAESELPGDASALFAETETIIGHFLKGQLRELWQTITIVGREVPIVVEYNLPSPRVLTGSIDLVYRDASDRWVIADYKTDHAPTGGDGELEEKYRPQGTAYCRAVQHALGLSTLPRFELWMIRSDTVLEVNVSP